MSQQPPGPRSKRRSANERYRQAFLVQVSTALHELSSLLEEEPDAQDSVAFELQKLAQTAESLDFQSIARAANDAAEELGHPDVGVRALRRVANAVRHTGGRVRFGPLVVVGVGGEAAEQLGRDALLCCEPLRMFDDLQAFAVGLHTEQPTTVVLPVDAVDAVAQLVSREKFPVLVHGPASAWELRAAAMSAGAHGFLVHPVSLRDITRFARWRSQASEDVIEVLLLADPGPTRDGLGAAMEQVGLAVVIASAPAELAVALEAGTAKAIVVGARVAGVSALTLAQLVRSHPRCNHLPILVSGKPDDPSALRIIGVDDVMRTDAQPLQAAQRVRDRILRVLAICWERDPISGLPNRLGVLDALDAELAKASRSQKPLSVVLVEVDGLRAAIETFGTIALYNARRLLVRLFDQHLRRTDLHGEIDTGELLVAMPGCDRDQALERMATIASRFLEEARRDLQLKSLQLLLGAADTLDGLHTVAVRAERDLRSVSGR